MAYLAPTPLLVRLMSRFSASPHFASTTVFLAASLWGLYWMPLRWLGDHGLQGLMPVVIFNLPAFLVLGLVMAWRWRLTQQTLARAFWIGLFSGLGMACYAAGLILAPVVRATMLFYLTPVWGTLIAIFWLRHHAGVSRWLAIVAGFAGLALLVAGGQGEIVPLGIGDALGLASGLLWAIAATLILCQPQIPVISTAFFQFAFAVIGAACFSWALGAPASFADLRHTLSPGIIAVSLTFMATILGIFWAQKRLSAGRTGLLMMSEVVVAVGTASWFLPEERLDPLAWLGAALIVGACLVEVLSDPLEELPA